MSQPRWRGLSHQEVYDRVHAGPGPYVSDGAVAAWNDAEATLRRIDGDLAAAIRKAGGWEGDAAEAARDGLTPLGRWAVGAADAAGRAALSLQEHQEQVAKVRAALPEPGPEVSEDPPFSLNDPGTDPANQEAWAAQAAANAERADQAFHVMDTYATNTGLIQHWVPAWTAPPTVTVVPAATAPARSGRPLGRAGTADLAAVLPAASATSPASGGPIPAGAPAMDGAVAGVPGGTSVAGQPGRASAAGTPGQAAGTTLAGTPGLAGTTLDGTPGAAAGTTVGGTPGRATPAGWRDLPGLGAGDPGAGAATAGRWSPTGSGTGDPPRAGAPAPGRSSPTGAGDPARTGSAPTTRWTPPGSADPSRAGAGEAGRWSSTGTAAPGGPGSGATGRWSGVDDPARTGQGSGARWSPGEDGGRPGAPGGAAGRGGAAVGPGEPGANRGAASGLGTPADPSPRAGAAAERAGYLPMAGTGAGSAGESTHPRPTFLVDDSGAFVDDRWFTEAVITPDDPLPWS